MTADSATVAREWIQHKGISPDFQITLIPSLAALLDRETAKARVDQLQGCLAFMHTVRTKVQIHDGFVSDLKLMKAQLAELNRAANERTEGEG